MFSCLLDGLKLPSGLPKQPRRQCCQINYGGNDFHTISNDNMTNRRYYGKTGFCDGAPTREVERPKTATAIFNLTRRLYTGLVSAEPLSMTSNKRPLKKGWRAGMTLASLIELLLDLRHAVLQD
jgi:hypothetical protein